MLTAQKITKKNLPQLKAAAKKFVKEHGDGAVRSSMSMFSGNTVLGIFDDNELVGWKVIGTDGNVLSEIGTTTVGTDSAPIFERVIDPFSAFEEEVSEPEIEETLQQSPEEAFGAELLENAKKSDLYLQAHPNVGRRKPPEGGYIPANSPKKNEKKMSPVKIVLGVILAIIVLASGFFSIYMAYNQLQARQAEADAARIAASEPNWDAYDSMPPDGMAHVQITSGDTLDVMREKLLQAGAVDIAKGFFDAVDVAQAQETLQAGDYIVLGNETASSFVERMVNGKRVPNGVIGINTGDTISSIANAIDKASLPFNGGSFLASVRDVNKWRGAYPMLLEAPAELPSLEGYFESGEYNLSDCASVDAAIARLLEPMERKFEQSSMSSIDFHNMLTKASLIEKEALFDEDRPLISSVIDNRLQAGSLLQIDAAVKYANNYDEARVYDIHLETDSPYNTYMYPGLPIGPICSGISQVDIDAALNPAQTDFFYYVLKDTEGHHQFCITPEEFEIAKNQYLELFGYNE